jgi:hypothetical protein
MKIPALITGCLFAGSLAFASAAQAAPLKFDFGTEQSAVFPGFTGVSNKTLFTEGAAFGFVKTAPGAFDRVRPNTLEADFVLSKTPASFRVNLPNGAYKAWFLYGDSRYNTRVLVNVAKKNFIAINGKEAVSDPLKDWKEFYTEKYYFRGYSNVYHAGDDFYEKYVAPNFKTVTAPFEVTDGQALFTLEDIPLCAMVVYPASEAATVEDDIAYLLKKELRRHTVIKEVKPDSLPPEPEYSQQEKGRGYALYSRFPTEPPLPTDRPLAAELNPTPSTFVSAGQKANLSLTVLPLQDLKNVKVSVSDLTDKASGAKIASGAVKVEYTALQEIASGSARTTSAAYIYEVKPIFIKPFPAAFGLMDKGINRTILLTVAADGSTRPGVYEGNVTVAPENAAAAKVPVRVRVLPITLPELPIIAGRYAMDSDFYYYLYWSKTFTGEDFTDFVWDRQKMRMQWAKDMGLNSIAWSDDMRGDILSDPMHFKPDGRFVRWMDLYRDMGFKVTPWYGFQAMTTYSARGDTYGFGGSPRNSPEWKAKYRQLIESIRDTGKARGWPEILFYLSDELSNEGTEGTEDGLQRIAASDGISGIRRIMSVNGKYEHPFIGKIEILMPNLAFPITRPIIDEMKAKNTELWLYNVTDQRFSWGYYPFLTGAKGRFQWFNNSGMGYPFDDFDSNYGDSVYSAFVAGPDGPISEVFSLNMRDGLDDLRYVTLLNQLVNQAKNPQSKAVQDAKSILAEIKALDPDLRNYTTSAIDAKATGISDVSKMWTPEACQRMRWRVAESIMALQK